MDRVCDINDYFGSGGNAGSNKVGLPDLEIMPLDDPSWAYLNQAIADEVLSFPVRLQTINDSIFFNANFDNMPDGPDPEWTLKPLYEVAVRTMELARRVRSKHGLKKTDWANDSEARLKEYQNDFLIKLSDRNSQSLPEL